MDRRSTLLGALLTSALVAIAVLTVPLVFPGLAKKLESVQYDLLFATVRVPPPIDERLVWFQVDDQTVDALGFPVPRHSHATVLEGLKQVGARVVVWDFIFGEHETDPQINAELAESLAGMPSVIGLGVQEYDPDEHRPPKTQLDEFDRFSVKLNDAAGLETFEPIRAQSQLQFQKAAVGAGHAGKTVDTDGVFRSAPLVVRIHGTEHTIPALGLAGVLAMLDVPHDDVVLEGHHLVLGRETLDEPIVIPVESGARMRVNYVRGWETELDRRSYLSQVESLEIAPELMADALQGRTVIIGSAFAGSGDFVPTPDQPKVPGVLAILNVMNTILTRQFIRTVPSAWVSVLALILAAGVALLFRLIRPRYFVVATVLIAIALAALSAALFRWTHLFFPVASPVACVLLSAGALAAIGHAREYARATRTSEVLSRFVSPALLGELETHGTGEFLPQPRRHEITVLFADIASFTPFTEATDPEVLSDFLERFYEMSMQVLFAHQGTLDKFQGDGILAYFGAPQSVADKELMAVRSALELIRGFEELVSEELEDVSLGIRCGVATGTVAVGYFGGLRYANYGIVGHVVNLAARLQGSAQVSEVYVDRATAEAVGGDSLNMKELEPVQLKGIAESVAVWSVRLPATRTATTGDSPQPVRDSPGE